MAAPHMVPLSGIIPNEDKGNNNMVIATCQSLQQCPHPDTCTCVEPNKPYFHDGSDAMLALEAMIDRAGLRNTVHALAHICGDKASHIRESWQDERLAKRWDAAARHFDKMTAAKVLAP